MIEVLVNREFVKFYADTLRKDAKSPSPKFVQDSLEEGYFNNLAKKYCLIMAVPSVSMGFSQKQTTNTSDYQEVEG